MATNKTKTKPKKEKMIGEVTLKEHLEDKIKGVEEKIDNRIDYLQTNIFLKLDNIQDKVNLTYDQARKTNGRVNKHDVDIAELDKTHDYCPGIDSKKKIKELEERMAETDRVVEIFKFADKHPKLTKAVLAAFIILLILTATKISMNTVPDIIKFFI